MKKVLGIGLIAAVFMFFGNLSVEAAKPVFKDATHRFDAKVMNLVKTVKLETKAQNAKRHKAPAPTPKAYQVGDVETFWATNVASNTNIQVQATLKAIGQSCYVFVENGKNLSEATVQKVCKTFDEKVYSIDTKMFGSEWKPGVDGDEHIFLLLLDIQDGYDGSNPNAGFVGGYFFAGNEFLQSEIPANVDVKSNEKEMLYLDIFPSDPTSDDYMGAVAHEFQHMIHFSNDPREFTWVNEACSQIAANLCGFGHQNQIMAYLETPDNSLTAWSETQMLANYGQVYLWNYFLMNRYLPAEADRAKFFTALVADQAKGIEGYENALKPFKTDFRKAFTEFSVANFVNDPKLDKGQYAYDKSLGRLKLPVTDNFTTFPKDMKETCLLWSADAIKVDLSAAKKQVKVGFGGAHAKFTEGKYNKFTVAAVITNSRGRAEPKISFIDVKPLPDNKAQIGELDYTLEADYDTMMIVVINEAPAEIPDAAYAKVPGLPYVVSIEDSGETVTARDSGVRPQNLVEEYRRVASNLSNADEKISTVAFTTIEGLTQDMTRAVKSEAETGSFNSVDGFIKAAGEGENRSALRPLAQKVADQLRFINSQSGKADPKIEERINLLTSF